MHSEHKASSERNVRKVRLPSSRTVRNTVTSKARTGLEILQASDVRCTVEILKGYWMLYKGVSTSHIEESEGENVASRS